MKRLVYLSLLATVFCSLTTVASCQKKHHHKDKEDAAPTNLRVVIIRHGEKPDQGNNLNCQGLNRAMQLPKVLFAKYGIASAVYVPSINSGGKTKSARTFQTITPYAVKYGLSINSSYADDDYKDIVADVMQRSGTVIMVWEHNSINNLAQAFGLKKPVNWSGQDFDSIWVITFKDGQPVLSTDKEGITPATGCSF